MTRIALRGLLSRKLRTFLTALAVVLGIAMVAGTYILTDTINKSFNTLMAQANANTSAVVSGKSLVSGGSTSDRPTVPASLLGRIDALPDVARAWGVVETESATLINERGNPVGPSGPPSLGFGRDPATFNRKDAFQIVDGSWAKGPGEVAIDVASAKKAHVGVGDTIRVEGSGPLERFRISGLLQWGSSDSLGGATMAVFDLPTAQRLFGMSGRLTGIDVQAADGVTPAQVVAQIKPLLPPHAQALTAAEQTKKDQSEWAAFARIIRYALLTFAGIALFVGAFVIFNTLSITVAQRTREMATLRTIGASRRQILAGVVVEGLAIGALASLVGIGLGIGLAKLLSALMGAIGIDVPRTATVYAPHTFVISIITGLLVTLLASLGPALRATRVPPIAAVREGATLPRGRLAHLRPIVSAVLLAAAMLLLGVGLFASFAQTSQRLLVLAAGCALLFIAVALLSAYFVRPLAALAGAPGSLIGRFPGRLARRNAVRVPARTASTAAALMIGLALVTFVSVLASGLARSTEVAIKKQASADYVVMANDGYSTYSNAVASTLSHLPGVEKSVALRADTVIAYGKEAGITGFDPKLAGSVYRFDWQKGSNASLAQLGRNGAIVTDSFAKKHRLEPGSPLPIEMPDGRKLQLHVVAVNKQPELISLLGDITVSQASFDAAYRNPKTTLITYLRTTGGQTDALAARLGKALKAFPGVSLMTEKKAIAAQSSGMNTLLAMFYVLLGLAVVVAIFGIINTLALAVFERTRELGMLRAIGLTRRQTRRMIRYESINISLIGAALGISTGVFLAALATTALSRYDIVFSLPLSSLGIFIAAAIIAGMLAAILPARRASRLNVLEALQYE
ncbi:MAG: FtsX-like permease family protein [Gaiellaceae bacterium]|jgi:putative ABC transport system permease protein